MSLALRLIPLAAILAAFSPRGSVAPLEESTWTSSGFRASLEQAAEQARRQLVDAPEIDWADVRVRSEDEHAPLTVEASVTWSGPVTDRRRDSLRSLVQSRFDSFACVEVVLAGEARR